MDPTQQTNQEYYDAHAEQWAAEKTHSFYSEAQFRMFADQLGAGSVVLDIGCGHGRDVPLFLGIGRHLGYEGLDISPKLIEIARSRYPQLPFHVGNVLDPKSLPPRKYDGFWAAAIFQHIPISDWPSLLSNVEQLTNVGGVGYFTVPHDRTAGRSEDPRHFTVVDESALDDLLTPRGWELFSCGDLPGTRNTTMWRWYIYRIYCA